MDPVSKPAMEGPASPAGPPLTRPSQLRVDAVYRNTQNWKKEADEFNRFFRFPDGGVDNVSGFRPKKRAGGSKKITDCAFCILTTTFGEHEWPDNLDPETGLFTYYGDNRKPGKELLDTWVKGNLLLEFLFHSLHLGKRELIPPMLCFESVQTEAGAGMRFLGLACPGAQGVSALEDLVAVWRVKGKERFQNYRSLFTILDTAVVERNWLGDLVNGVSALESSTCPEVWRRFVNKGLYTPLKAALQPVPRTKSDQMVKTNREAGILQAVYEGLTDREFEFAAAAIVELMDQRFVDLDVTRPTKDGGRDVIGSYRIGHPSHEVSLITAIEAKHWAPTSSVGVKPMARLISRLRHRDLGVFVTTGYFDRQVQEELIEDRHPVLLVAGGDIARILISCEIENPLPNGKLGAWLAAIRTRAATSIVPGPIPMAPEYTQALGD